MAPKQLSITIAITIISLFCLSSQTLAQTPPWPGSGTSADPYQITSTDDLLAFKSTNRYNNKHFILTADIAFPEDNLYTGPIIGPDMSLSFSGTFDGNYHTISNLNLSNPGTNSKYIGLFGYISYMGVVKNLGIENMTVSVGTSASDVGSLAGHSDGNISNCYATGSVHARSNGSHIGGLIGACGGYVYNSYTNVNVDADSYTHIIGGFIGITMGYTINCYASGTATGYPATTVSRFIDSSYFPNTVINCYYRDYDNGGATTERYATPLSHEQMQNQLNFFTWDFFGETPNGLNEIWTMDTYPILSWQKPVALLELSLLSEYWLTSGFDQGQPNARADWYNDNRIDMNDLLQLANSYLKPMVEKVYPLAPGDDFETGDFTNQPWTFTGDTPWTIDSSTAQDGTYSARSGVVSDSQASRLELTVDTTGYDLITFYYKVSSEENFDGIQFYINGNLRLSHKGESDGWIYRTFPVYDGLTTFKWGYYKDASGSDGQDAAWIDTIIFTREE